jgi:hypothetical protein
VEQERCPAAVCQGPAVVRCMCAVWQEGGQQAAYRLVSWQVVSRAADQPLGTPHIWVGCLPACCG